MSEPTTQQSPSLAKLLPALIKARGEFAALIKDSLNPHFQSAYASLAAVLEACEIPLGKNDLAILQVPVWDGSGLVLQTTLAHSSGEWIRSTYPVGADVNRPQETGKGMTYARRYTYMSVAGIAPEDDDGEAASGRGNGAQGHQPAPRAPQRQNGHANGNGHTNGNGHAKPAPSQAATAVAPTPRCIKCARMAIQPVTTPAGLVCYECCERRCDFCHERGKARVERADGKVICKDCSKRQDEEHARAAFVAAPAPAPEARTNNTRLPISGPELYSWASKLERQNGPGLIRHMTERAQNLGWPNCSRIVSWDAGQVADAFADAEECLELIFGASDEDEGRFDDVDNRYDN